MKKVLKTVEKYEKLATFSLVSLEQTQKQLVQFKKYFQFPLDISSVDIVPVYVLPFAEYKSYFVLLLIFTADGDKWLKKILQNFKKISFISGMNFLHPL